MAQRFAITSRAEAIAFLQNPVLRGRLYEITAVVASQLNAGVEPVFLMGSEIDCQKLASSMTLFKLIATEIDDQEFRTATKTVLANLAQHGWESCTTTLNWLKL